jgi:membrane-bound ClpP family serine protease
VTHLDLPAHLATAATAAAVATDGGDTSLILGFVFVGVAVFFFLLELLVPSGGILGLLSALAAIASIAAMFSYDPLWGVATLASFVVLGPLAIWFAIRLWTQSPLARKMILQATESDPTPEDGVPPEVSTSLDPLVGKEGTAVTPLRPVGFVRIDGRRLDAVADFGVIESDRPIVVVGVRDNAVRVRERD